MVTSRQKKLAHRKKTMVAETLVKLVEPITVDSPKSVKVLEKIKVPSLKERSALVPGEGRSMGMDIG
jgi:large subunit ribosomal protein L24e